MCSHVCSVCYCLNGDALLMYSGVVSMRLHLHCFDVCWSFGVLVGVLSVWHQVALSFFNYHKDARSNILKIKYTFVKIITFLSFSGYSCFLLRCIAY